MLNVTEISMAFHRAFPSVCKPRSTHGGRTCDSLTFAFSFINPFPVNVLEAWSLWAGGRITSSCSRLLSFLNNFSICSLLQTSNFLFGALLQPHLHCKSKEAPLESTNWICNNTQTATWIREDHGCCDTGAVTCKKWKIMVTFPWSNVSAVSHRYVYRIWFSSLWELSSVTHTHRV